LYYIDNEEKPLFEVLVCFGPGDNRELLAAVGL
jgi:hypothetical protein